MPPTVEALPDGWGDNPALLAAQISEQGRQLAIGGKPREALEHFAKALTLDPRNVPALVGSGAAAAECKLYDESQRYTRAALDLALCDQDAAVCWNNLGFSHYVRRDYAAALDCMDKAMALDRYYKQPVVTKGAVLVVQDRLEEAYALFERASLMNPGDWEPMVNRGILHLLWGNWPLGLPGYEHRQVQGEAAEVNWPVPRWNGEPLRGRAVIVWPDQGLGDCIWAHRLVAQVAKQGTVYLQIYPQLENILPLPEGVTLVRAGESIKELHFHVPVMSLPYCLRVDPQHPPAATGLAVKRARTGNGGARIGLCWSGNINHKLDDLRSIPLALMDTVRAAVPTAQWWCLQHEIRMSDRAFMQDQFVNVPPSSFEELAETIAGLDLVISVDTAVLHVAAEMGVPTWGLIPLACDFRWGLKAADLPWYPSLTMYRNRASKGGWDEVLERVKGDLEEQFGAHRP